MLLAVVKWRPPDGLASEKFGKIMLYQMTDTVRVLEYY